MVTCVPRRVCVLVYEECLGSCRTRRQQQPGRVATIGMDINFFPSEQKGSLLCLLFFFSIFFLCFFGVECPVPDIQLPPRWLNKTQPELPVHRAA